jgi:hypothetical protein
MFHFEGHAAFAFRPTPSLGRKGFQYQISETAMQFFAVNDVFETIISIMYIPRSITAVLEERLLFNFTISPQQLSKILPVKWLKPLIIKERSIVSFCILHLKNVTIWPLPGSVIGYKTISCAYRCGTLDTSCAAAPLPAVWIVDRLSDLPVIAKLSPWLLNDTLPIIRPRIRHSHGDIAVEIDFPDSEKLFKAELRPNAEGERFKSKIFSSMADFSKFIHDGVTSYAASIYGDALTKIDLIKEDPVYQPCTAEVDYSWLNSTWKDAELQFDSAVRAHGGTYKWNYRGLVPMVDGQEDLFKELRISKSRRSQ